MLTKILENNLNNIKEGLKMFEEIIAGINKIFLIAVIVIILFLIF
tara:strand:+ start:370 stop:504 length:135 start_codon:yes stop_codon:yes gene_type:complete